MKSKLLVEISSLDQGLHFIESKVDALLLNIMGLSVSKEFSCYTDELAFLAQKAIENNVEILVNLDMLYHEEDLMGLKAILRRLEKFNVKAVLISDVAVLELIEELDLNLKCINGINTLNTNYHTMKASSSIFDGFFISNEINVEEVVEITKNVDASLIVQVFGKQKMFYSKRKLLTSYYEFNEIKVEDFRCKNRLVISNKGQEDHYSYIYEDDFGTYIYSRHNLNALKYINQFIENGVEYLYLNNIFCLEEEYNNIVKVFQDYLNQDSYLLDEAIEDLSKYTTHLSESFLEDKTVFTIEDAKIMEGEKKNG